MAENDLSSLPEVLIKIRRYEAITDIKSSNQVTLLDRLKRRQ